MNSILDIIFLRRNNFKNISASIKDLSTHKKVDQIFKAIKQNSTSGEIRYVGGCIRKILNNEVVDDIDLATNLEPQEVCEILKNNNSKFYESGIEHGTITAMIDNFKFEITTLREDVETDGRHAKIKFSKDWKKDASRRDFTINSIYSDDSGNLFDPFNGKKDLENGYIKFIGEPDKRIKEDYLRILRYLRFYSNYSKHHHDTDVIKKIKINSLINVKVENLESVLGKPNFVIIDEVMNLWQYEFGKCIIDFFLKFSENNYSVVFIDIRATELGYSTDMTTCEKELSNALSH